MPPAIRLHSAMGYVSPDERSAMLSELIGKNHGKLQETLKLREEKQVASKVAKRLGSDYN